MKTSKYGMTGIHLRYLQTININCYRLLKVNIVREVRELFHHTFGRHHTLSLRNRVMILIWWLRSYPSYHMLSALIDKSVPTVKEEIHSCIPVLREKYRQHVRWPTLEEWTNFQERWQQLPFDIGGKDVTSTEIYRQGIEP